jgi:hypothetical protein
MKKNFIYFLLFVSISSFLFVACGSDNDSKDPIPDVSNIKIDVKFRRFEQELFKIDTNNVVLGFQNLKQQFPMMTEVFTQHVINDGQFSTPEQVLGGFIKSPSVRKLNDTVQIAYREVADLEKDIKQALQFYKYYFPKKVVPEVNTYLSEYSIPAFTYGDSLLAIGLDLYLGENHTGYDPNYFPKYTTRSMNKEHLLSKTMTALAQDLAGQAQGNNRLLDVMIQKGKVLYVVDKFLPYTPDSIKFEYSAKQMAWCTTNEAEVWSYLLSEKLLYSVKQMDWAKLVNPSPTGTTKMPTNSPGRAGNWMGYRIIRAYMKKHPNTSLEQLMALKDAQKILDESKYKPKRK